MAEVTGLGTSWNLPNYAGELFTADAVQTPFLSMIGGLTGGMQTENFEFPTAVLFDYPAPKQPEISEKGSATAPEATHSTRSQESNVVQIFHETINLSYVKQSNKGRMSGLNTAGQTPNPSDEKTFQIQQKLVKIARDVEHTFINGKYQKSNGEDVANKTRGMLELCSDGSTVDAGASALTRELLDALILEMATNGAYFNNMVLFASAKNKQLITKLFENKFYTDSRNIGGMNIQQIETDFCMLGIAWDRFIPDDSILIADIAHVAPVFQAVPEKGVLFEEPLAKTGASDKSQIFGQIGLAHGASFLHGSITNLK